MAAASGAGGAVDKSEKEDHTIVMDKLDFKYDTRLPTILHGVDFKLKRGQRLLLCGDNGAGKTTMLRILAGKHMHERNKAQLLGRSAFHDLGLAHHRAFMASDWGRHTVAFAGYGCPLQADIAVKDMMKDLQEQFKDRKQMLVDLLGVNMDWRMHQVSDGQRRRVQIFLQLLRPVEVFLLDEVTVDLDVITRSDFLQFLKDESEQRGVTIIYATHIFDGLAEWFTHIGYIAGGALTRFQHRDECSDFKEIRESGSSAPLLRTVEKWLRADKIKGKSEKMLGTDGRVPERGVATADSVFGNGYTPGRLASVIAEEEELKEKRARREAAAKEAADKEAAAAGGGGGVLTQ